MWGKVVITSVQRSEAAANRPNFAPSIAGSYDHLPSLDGLRAVSIIAVLTTHFAIPAGPGGYGVFLFFIISGFLITRLLFAEQKQQVVSLRSFYLRRIFRLYPVLVVFTCGTVATSLTFHFPFAWDEPAAALLYYSNYLIVHKELQSIPWSIDAFQVFWSLSIEEHFYLLFPFVFIMLRTPRSLLIFSSLVVVACAGARFVVAEIHPNLIPTHYFGMLTQYRIDSIALGVLLAAALEGKTGPALVGACARYSTLSGAAVVLLLGFVLLRDPAIKTALRWPLLGFPLLVMITAVVFSSKHKLALAILNHPAMIQTGKLSYSLYVWHMVAGYAAFSIFPGKAGIPLAFALSYAIAWASYRAIERPMIRLGHRLQRNFRQRTSSAPEASAA